jgi:SpoVK/Ycf46/Vps4 family AAA+-type ATPase
VVRVLPVKAGLVAIDGNPLFGGLTGRLDGLENCAPALLRRIQRHIKSRNPDASKRLELFALNLPSPDRVEADDAVLSELSKGLSGGDILNICVDAIHAGSRDTDPMRWSTRARSKVSSGRLGFSWDDERRNSF